jgi:hypothetical protein
MQRFKATAGVEPATSGRALRSSDELRRRWVVRGGGDFGRSKRPGHLRGLGELTGLYVAQACTGCTAQGRLGHLD